MTEPPPFHNIFKSTETRGNHWISNGGLRLGTSTSETVDGIVVYTESGGEITVVVDGNEYVLTRQILSYLVGLSGDLQETLDQKADIDYVDGLFETVETGGVSESWVTTQLADYVTSAALTAFAFASIAWVTAQNFATQSWVSAQSYATTSSVDSGLATKAATSYVDSENAAQNTTIATKAATTYVDSGLATKASISYVDSQNAAQNTTIATKASTTYVDSIVAGSGFATTGYVDSGLATKRDTTNTTFSSLTSTGGVSLHSGLFIDGVNWLRKNTYLHGVPLFLTFDQSGDNRYHVLYRDSNNYLVIDSEHYTNAGGGGVRFKLKEVGTSNVADVLTVNPTSVALTKPLTTSSTIAGVSSAELGRLIGVTSAVQTQLDAKCTQSYCDTANAAQDLIIATKANDSATVHRTSNELITGSKNFQNDTGGTYDNIQITSGNTGAGRGRVFLRSGSSAGAYNPSTVNADFLCCYGGTSAGINVGFNLCPWSNVNSGTRWYGQTVANTAMAWSFSANSSMAFSCPVTFSGNITANGQTITPAVLGYLSGATSNLQTQLNNRVTLDTLQTVSGIKTFTNGFQTAAINLAPSTTSIPCASLTLSYGSAVRQHHCTAGYIFHKTGSGNTNAWPITVSQYSVGSYSDNADTYLYLNPAFSVTIFQNAGYGGTPQTFNANMVPQSWAIDTPNTMSSIKVYYYGTEITIPGVSTA